MSENRTAPMRFPAKAPPVASVDLADRLAAGGSAEDAHRGARELQGERSG